MQPAYLHEPTQFMNYQIVIQERIPEEIRYGRPSLRWSIEISDFDPHATEVLLQVNVCKWSEFLKLLRFQ